MSGLLVAIEGDRQVFRPGDTISGQVAWELASPPRGIDVRLFWFTRGRGTQDVSVAETQAIAAPPASGVYGFVFTLPAEGPVSFSGQLVSLVWAVEAVAQPSAEVARQEFVVSTTEAALDLTRNSALAEKEDEAFTFRGPES